MFREKTECAYFKGKQATLEYVLAEAETAERYGEYLARGYRRIGNYFYRSVCVDCTACVALRLRPDEFALGKGQKRTLKANLDVRMECVSPSFLTWEKIELYRKYLHNKHPDGDPMRLINAPDMLGLVHYGYPHSIEMDYYMGGKLIGVGIVDEAADALSANYFYYDTDYLKRRPGIFSIIKEIGLANRMGKPYYYLGYCIEGLPKMSYKKDFRPNYVLLNGKWERSGN